MTTVCPAHRRTDPAQLRRLTAARVLELTPDIAVVTDYEGTILFANAALEQRLGVPGRRAARRSSSATSCTPRTASPRCRRGRSCWRGERDGLELALRFGSADTGWRWCLGSVGIDRELGVTIGTYQETTALRDAEERFQRAFEDAAIGMAITGTDGRFVRVNHSLAAMLGREPQRAGRRGGARHHPSRPPRGRPRGDARARQPASRTPTAPRSATCAPTAARRGSPCT